MWERFHRGGPPTFSVNFHGDMVTTEVEPVTKDVGSSTPGATERPATSAPPVVTMWYFFSHGGYSEGVAAGDTIVAGLDPFMSGTTDSPGDPPAMTPLAR